VRPLSDEALVHGGQRADPLTTHVARLAVLATEQGRFQDGIEFAREWAKRLRDHAIARAQIALLQAESGDHVAARQALEELTADDLAAVPRDVVWPASLSRLAETCAYLRDADRAPRLYEHMRPHAGHLVSNGGALPAGAADRYLGMLAATQGRFDQAEAHYTTALELEDRLKAPPLTARTRYWYARALIEREAAGDHDRAAELLSASLATADELGMTALVSAARELRDSI
jgi:tetratricopeptide (TPR) repeat protein